MQRNLNSVFTLYPDIISYVKVFHIYLFLLSSDNETLIVQQDRKS